MTDIDWQEAAEPLIEIRRQEHVLEAMANMMRCPKRGVCLLHEWIRRYGSPGNGCRCFERFHEHITDRDIP